MGEPAGSQQPTSTQVVRASPFTASAGGLEGKRAAVVLFSHYPSDPRPRREAEALAKQGMRVEVICLRQTRDQPRRQAFNGVDVLRLPIRRRRGGALSYLADYSSFILMCFFLLTARSLRRRLDLVHVHNMPDVLVFSALVPKLLGARVILDLHDPMPELMMTIFNLTETSRLVRLLKRLERWSIAFADLVFTPNLAFKQLFSRRNAQQSEKIHIVMNSPDEEIFTFRPVVHSARNPARPFVVMYHGSILERNGLDVAVAAVAAVRNTLSGVELRIYGGSTGFLDRVMAAVKEQRLQDTVRYLGAKPLEGIVTAIDECDVGIIPNQRSVFTALNMPTRIFEYLSRGKPVVAPQTPGIQDYFGDHSLFFFELGDAADLARVIAHVSRHPEEVERVVKRGQEVYLSHRWSEERRDLVSRAAALLNGGRR